MRRAALALALSGCLAPRPELREARIVLQETNALRLLPVLTCTRYSSLHIGFTGTGVGLAVVGGGSSLSAIFTGTTAREAAGFVGVGLAVLSATFTSVGAGFGSLYTQGCTVNTGGAP